MILERIFQEWLSRRANSTAEAHNLVVEVAHKDLDALETDDKVWLSESLNDEMRKFFTAAIFGESGKLPEELYEPMLRAAVYEPSPLKAQAFVEPCVKSFGVKRVHNTLMDYLGSGSNYEKTGAVNALHWCVQATHGVHQETVGQSQPDGELLKLQEIQRRLYMKTFIENADIDLRRALISHMALDQLAPTVTTQELIDKVVKIARTHPDQYIRSRLDVQLGRAHSQYPLPPRKPITSIISKKQMSWWKQLWK